MSDQFDLAIFEAGISMPGEMERLADVIQPTVGILTNLGEAHQENFSNVTKKLEEKLKLFSPCDTIIYRKDQEEVSRLRKETYSRSSKKLIGWSTVDEKADLLLKMDIGLASTRIEFKWHTSSKITPSTTQRGF